MKTGQVPQEQLSIGLLLACNSYRWHHAVGIAIKAFNISPIQFALLSGISLLSTSVEPVTQSYLARYLGVDAMLTSKNIRFLESNKMVRRSKHPNDSRAYLLSLTSKGAATLKRATRVVDRVDADLFVSLASDKIQKQLAATLG